MWPGLASRAYIAALILVNVALAADPEWKPISFMLDPVSPIIGWAGGWLVAFGGVTSPQPNQVGWGPSQRVFDASLNSAQDLADTTFNSISARPPLLASEMRVYGGRSPPQLGGKPDFNALVNQTTSAKAVPTVVSPGVQVPGKNGSAISIDIPWPNTTVDVFAAGGQAMYIVDAVGFTTRIMTNYSVDQIPRVTEFFVINGAINPRLRWVNETNWQVVKGVGAQGYSPLPGPGDTAGSGNESGGHSSAHAATFTDHAAGAGAPATFTENAAGSGVPATPTGAGTATAPIASTVAFSTVAATFTENAAGSGVPATPPGAGTATVAVATSAPAPVPSSPSKDSGPEDYWQVISPHFSTKCEIPIPDGTAFIIINGTTGLSRTKLDVQINPPPPSHGSSNGIVESFDSANSVWATDTILYLRELDPSVHYNVTLSPHPSEAFWINTVGLHSITYLQGLEPAKVAAAVNSSPGTSIPTIVGGVAGGVVGALVLAVLAAYFCIWRPRKRKQRELEEVWDVPTVDQSGYMSNMRQVSDSEATIQAIPPSYNPAWANQFPTEWSDAQTNNSSADLLPGPSTQGISTRAKYTYTPSTTGGSGGSGPATPTQVVAAEWKRPYLPETHGGAVLAGSAGPAESNQRGLFGKKKTRKSYPREKSSA
ncbi:hypothetical protein CspeluHIS016_0402680 [Cutaneotrichosporon spelunceum]|uniref:Mid2 domain-containing protein n=1 Tax=Cutaneotrichosporon spelunceum TaxID=1672016 RepID=A0AAD3TV39_9TREE|nr:hypothetical protein CspeluHIS016_0402680 [Cutaneotrichosporon spelunceum]